LYAKGALVSNEALLSVASYGHGTVVTTLMPPFTWHGVKCNIRCPELLGYNIDTSASTVLQATFWQLRIADAGRDTSHHFAARSVKDSKEVSDGM
jgi:hypothetical protein